MIFVLFVHTSFYLVQTTALYERFEELFREHYGPLANYAFSLVKDRQDAEDAVQDVFIRIWQHHQDMIQNEGVKFYLYTATKNTCISLLRKQATRSSANPEELLASRPDTVTDPVTPVDYRQLVQEAFSLLPPQCLAIFKLSRLAGLTYAQIASELNLSVKTIENQMGKALRLMREFARQKNIPLPVLGILLLRYLASVQGFS